MDKVEIRSFESEPLELRASDSGDGMTFSGYAVRYNEPSLPMPFTEFVDPTALNKTLRSRNDVRMYLNHSDLHVLGSTRAKTLTLENRSDGLFATADIPDTSYGNDLQVLIQRGDVRTMSFGFSTVKDAWSEDGSTRTLKEIRLHEVSVITGVAAYPSTTAAVRNLTLIAKRTATDVDALADAISALESGSDLTADQAALLRSVVDKSAGIVEPPAAPEVVPVTVLAKKLDLIAKTIGI